jgi:hypothetical protein
LTFCLFENLDKGRSTIDGKKLERFTWICPGIPIEHNFQLLVERRAAAEER